MLFFLGLKVCFFFSRTFIFCRLRRFFLRRVRSHWSPSSSGGTSSWKRLGDFLVHPSTILSSSKAERLSRLGSLAAGLRESRSMNSTDFFFFSTGRVRSACFTRGGAGATSFSFSMVSARGFDSRAASSLRGAGSALVFRGGWLSAGSGSVDFSGTSGSVDFSGSAGSTADTSASSFSTSRTTFSISTGLSSRGGGETGFSSMGGLLQELSWF